MLETVNNLSLFQSAPGFWAGRYTNGGMGMATQLSFNPLPAFGPGDTILVILSLAPTLRFNPLPAFGPGDTFSGRLDKATILSFNPLPAFGPGDTILLQRPYYYFKVSIRSRLLGREIPLSDVPIQFVWDVSIRSRLLGREIRQGATTKAAGSLFQSAPGFWAGRYLLSCYTPCVKLLFQSAPGFWAGRYPRPYDHEAQ